MSSRARYDRFLGALVRRYFEWIQPGGHPLCLSYINIATALKAIAEAARSEGDEGVAVGAAQLATAYRMAGPLRPLLH